MVFCIDFASDMPYCVQENYWWRSGLSRLQQLHGEHPWSHCYKNTSPMTFTMLMKPAFSTRCQPTELLPSEMKLCKAQRHLNSKDRLSLLLCTNLTGTDKLPTPTDWQGCKTPCPEEDGSWPEASLKSTNTIIAMDGWLQLSLNIGWTNGMRDWPGNNDTSFFSYTMPLPT